MEYSTDVTVSQAVNQNRDRLLELLADLVETATDINYLPMSQRVTKVLAAVADRFKDRGFKKAIENRVNCPEVWARDGRNRSAKDLPKITEILGR
jgi:hypothetical protein